MDSNLLYNNIQKYCAEQDITVSQLEKLLNFSTGLIGKWKQSAPSIEKVMLVADYFEISLDELCGIKRKVERSDFMTALIQKTSAEEINWYPCTQKEIDQLRFYPPQSYKGSGEIYEAVYGEGKLYFISQETFEMFISLKDGWCMKQNENHQQLQELWSALKEQEQQMQERINDYKKLFLD